MATSNGPWQNRGRIEWYWSISGSGNSRTVYAEAYLRMDQYASTGTNAPYSYSGSWGSGSGSRQLNIGAGQRAIVFSKSTTFSLGDTPTTISLGFSVTHFHGSTGSTLSFQLPAKVPSAPGTPTITRNSDTSHQLNWSRYSTYTSVVVQRSTNGSSGWVEVGRPSGNAFTFTDTTTVANQRYYYRVAGVSAGGQSGWSSVAGPVFTTPKAVDAVSAVKVDTDIQVDVSGLPGFADSFTVQASQSGGAFANLQTGVTSWPWTHVAPNSAVTWAYRVVSVKGSLQSVPSAVSNTVQLLAPPLAPTGLAPNGGVSASDGDVRFLWVHNPVDTTAQTAYELRYRVPAGAWTTLSGATAQFRDVTLALGSYEWQVRTKGEHAEFGEWSAVATVTVITRPGVAVQGDGSHDSPVYEVVWTWTQAESRPQSAWQVELLDEGSNRLELREGSGAQTSLTLSTRLVDGASYTVRVRAATGSVWSAWSPLVLTVGFVPPAPALVDAVWSEPSGTVELTVADGRGPDIPDVTNLFTNPNLVGDGTWVEVRRNLIADPRLTSLSLTPAEGAGVATRGEWGGLFVTRTSAASVGWERATPIAADGRYVLSAKGPVGVLMANRLWNQSYTQAGVTIVESTRIGDRSILILDLVGVTTLRYRLVLMNTNTTEGVEYSFNDLMLEKSGVYLPYFDGSFVGGQVQPEDFRTRWIGAVNAAESVLEIEQVRGLTATNCVAGVSTKGGNPAARLIPTTTSNTSFVTVTSAAISSGGTWMATVHLGVPLTGTLDRRRAGLDWHSPQTDGPSGVNAAGSYPLRQQVGPFTSLNNVRMWHGGTQGSGDIWWTGIGLFAGDYDGPAFSGDSGFVTIGDSVLATSWDGEEDNSTSTATMASPADSIVIERSVDGVVWEPFVPVTVFDDVLAFSDAESLSAGSTFYRVTATDSVTGAASITIYEVVADSEHMWLSGGVGYGITARLPFSPQIELEPGRERGVEYTSGSPLPVAYAGEQLSRIAKVGGVVAEHEVEESAYVDDLTTLAQHPSPVFMLRTPDGLRMYGIISSVPMPRQNGLGWWGYSFTLTETSH